MRTLISLGPVCNVAFQLRMHSGDNTSHFFDWLETPFAGLIYTLENNFDVFHPEHLVLDFVAPSSCIRDVVTQIKFFHHFSYYKNLIPDTFLLEYPNFIGKFQHLAARFQETVVSKPVTLVRQHITFAEAEQLEQVFFKKFPNTDVDFLYIVRPDQGFVTRHGWTVEMESLKTGFGDILAWAELLTFHKIITKPFRLSTVEILTKNSHDNNFTYLNKHSVAALKIACQYSPDNPWFFYELSLQYIVHENWGEAFDAIAKAIEIDNSNVEFCRVQLKIKEHCHKITPQQLAQELMDLSCAKTANASLYHYLLTALMKVEQYETALGIVNNLLAIDPLNSKIYFHKAECLQKLGRGNLAQLAIDKAITINPEPAHYHSFKSKL